MKRAHPDWLLRTWIHGEQGEVYKWDFAKEGAAEKINERGQNGTTR